MQWTSIPKTATNHSTSIINHNLKSTFSLPTCTRPCTPLHHPIRLWSHTSGLLKACNHIFIKSTWLKDSIRRVTNHIPLPPPNPTSSDTLCQPSTKLSSTKHNHMPSINLKVQATNKKKFSKSGANRLRLKDKITTCSK